MKKKTVFIIYVLFVLTNVFNIVNAAGLADIYSPLSGGEASPLYSAAALVVGRIKWVGVFICVGMLMYKGIKFMMVSPDGKAEIKKEMVVWTIGTVILFSFLSIVDFILSVVEKTGLQTI